MKTNEEMEVLKKEYQNLNNELKGLSDYELGFVIGGASGRRKYILNRVSMIVHDNFGLSNNSFALNSSFQELSADSLDVVDIVSCVEKEFDIRFKDDEIAKIVKISDLVDLVNNRL